MKRLLTLIMTLALTIMPIATLAQSPNLPLEPDLGLQSTTFVSELDFPVGMAVLPDGSLLVGTSPSTSDGYYASTGEIVRLSDADGDGVADQPYETVATGLPGAVTALALAGNILFVTSTDPSNPSITALRLSDDFSGPYEVVGSLDFGFQEALHTTYGLVTRETPDDTGSWDLIFNVGAHGNDEGGSMVPVTGLFEDTLPDSAVYLVTVHDDGATLGFRKPIAVATGIRNTSAMAFDPATGDLWIAENGIDGLVDPYVSFSADELNIVPAEDIGSQTIDFGFPSTYTRYDTGEVTGTGGVQPFTVFLPIDGSESEGISSLAFAPESFPEDLREGVFAGFHGQFDMTGIENEENPLLWASTATPGDHRTVVGNDAENVGHIDTLVSTPDALFVADMCADGYMWQTDPCGVIYRVTGAVSSQ